jgi:hypothetical protein
VGTKPPRPELGETPVRAEIRAKIQPHFLVNVIYLMGLGVKGKMWLFHRFLAIG